MQVDANYGIIPDTQEQIQSNYLSFLQNVFVNANSPDDPTYVIANTCAYFDSLNQAGLEVLWNTVNANTASGLGLDMLANTVLNLFRRQLTPSTALMKITVQNLLSYVDVTINVTLTSPPKTLATGWSVTGSVSPSPAYATLQDYTLAADGIYTIRLFSTDITTAVPIGSLTTAGAVSGVTFNSVTNSSAATLGSLTIPADWAVTASSITNSPIYTPRQNYVYNTLGDKYLLLYSDNITVPIPMLALNVFPNYANANPAVVQNMIAPHSSSTGTNLQAAILGLPTESDAQFAARRRYYLNVDGQTYYGMEKAILNVQAPALRSVFVEEVITDTYNPSILIVKITVTYTSTPIVIPVNWTVTLSVSPSAPYKTNASYSFSASGDYYIPVFSTDETTAVPIGSVTGGDAVAGVVVVGNLDPAILKTTVGLGQRGYKIWLDYPTIAGGVFDTQDIYLQKIASAAYEYHPLGTNFYSGGSGNTVFTVNTPYNGYTADVILTPMQQIQISCVLRLVYNTDPKDQALGQQVFTANLATIKTEITKIINDYFKSKTLPSDNVYSISDIIQILEATYTGIVSFNNATTPFTLGRIDLPTTGRVYLTRVNGSYFNLDEANFDFLAINKDSL